jgi:hypothetical protein
MPLAQKDIKLVSTSQPDYIIAPDCYHHKSIYMEKKAEAGKPTVFTFDFTYTETDRWYGFDESAVKPYVTAPSTNASGNDAGSSARTASAVAAREASAAIYREYTAERAPHIVFSPRIRRLADSLTAGIDNPYRKFVSIYSWVYWKNRGQCLARCYAVRAELPEAAEVEPAGSLHLSVALFNRDAARDKSSVAGEDVYNGELLRDGCRFTYVDGNLDVSGQIAELVDAYPRIGLLRLAK